MLLALSFNIQSKQFTGSAVVYFVITTGNILFLGMQLRVFSCSSCGQDSHVLIANTHLTIHAIVYSSHDLILCCNFRIDQKTAFLITHLLSQVYIFVLHSLTSVYLSVIFVFIPSQTLVNTRMQSSERSAFCTSLQ